MPKLILIGSIAATGGVVGMGGLGLELLKPTSRTASTSRMGKSLALKRCQLYSIVSSDNLTVQKENESTFKTKVTNNSVRERIDRDCGIKDRVFVAYRSNNWVYEDSDQGKPWKV
ncbi:hypothetical protein MHF_0417 [Mycoplasma haemofelis Ohio2]|uniref:Uncharacterized protein n=1 Tax=Mycoplasma haemofelis (strain Ohio2) TaxID=859194 RepID=F6FH88_MYCHI|nr:hypothetical protein MHF_0417 [Mycoplasma haemofelis Ohio2]